MTEPTKYVWILGAGFSRSLGGPLLTQLLSEASHGHIRRVYDAAKPFQAASATFRWVYRLYQYGTKYKYGRIHAADATDGIDLWSDAEVFLDQLDTAAANPTGTLAYHFQDLILSLMHPSDRLPALPELAQMAKRIVAAECCAFLKDDPTKTERWEPYRDWGKELGKDDTIITFNYDRVVESVCRRAVPVLSAEDYDDARDSQSPTLYKLHGSVDWKMTTDEQTKRVHLSLESNPEFAVECENGEICIGTPGPNKAALAASLKPIWDLAIGSIEEADAVVFMGFRFPPTDAMARKGLLGALWKNSQHYAHVHIVLGEDVRDPSVIRLEGLLEAATARQGNNNSSVRVHKPHPLRAEDFLTVWNRKMLVSDR